MGDFKIVRFDHIRLEEAENGFVLEFTEIKEFPETFEDRKHINKQFVYDSSEGASEALDMALAKMKSLLMFNRMKKEGNPMIELPSLIGAMMKKS